jgi:hypothetical protein
MIGNGFLPQAFATALYDLGLPILIAISRYENPATATNPKLKAKPLKKTA